MLFACSLGWYKLPCDLVLANDFQEWYKINNIAAYSQYLVFWINGYQSHISSAKTTYLVNLVCLQPQPMGHFSSHHSVRCHTIPLWLLPFFLCHYCLLCTVILKWNVNYITYWHENINISNAVRKINIKS